MPLPNTICRSCSIMFDITFLRCNLELENYEIGSWSGIGTSTIHVIWNCCQCKKSIEKFWIIVSYFQLLSLQAYWMFSNIESCWSRVIRSQIWYRSVWSSRYLHVYWNWISKHLLYNCGLRTIMRLEHLVVPHLRYQPLIIFCFCCTCNFFLL